MKVYVVRLKDYHVDTDEIIEVLSKLEDAIDNVKTYIGYEAERYKYPGKIIEIERGWKHMEVTITYEEHEVK